MVYGQLHERIFNVMDAHESLALCKDILYSGGSYVVVGIGGSKSPASYIAQLIASLHNTPAICMSPYDYSRGLGFKTNWLIVVTYSGNTYDCRLAIEKAQALGVNRVALVTGKSKPKLASYLRNINLPHGDVLITYEKKGLPQEKSFLSFAGTILPSYLFAKSANLDINSNYLISLLTSTYNLDTGIIEEIVRRLKTQKRNVIEIIGGGYAWPAMIDLESKFVEGNVSAVQIHESKDYSHGRFMLSLKRPGLSYPKILLQAGDDDYERTLFRILEGKSRNTATLRIKSKDDNLLGGLELLVHTQNFVYQVAKILYKCDSDITKPKLGSIPRAGLELYKWPTKRQHREKK